VGASFQLAFSDETEEGKLETGATGRPRRRGRPNRESKQVEGLEKEGARRSTTGSITDPSRPGGPR